MNICIIDEFSEGPIKPVIEELRRKGFYVSADPDSNTDVIMLFSIARMNKAYEYLERYPNIPLIVYCWDYYSWVDSPSYSSWDWARYSNLLKRATAVWFPSVASHHYITKKLDLKNIAVIYSNVVCTPRKTSDQRFVLNPLREIPDPNFGMFERVAARLGIPTVTPNHQCTYEEFLDYVANCSFLVSTYEEASTGGLSLVEGLYLGKPTLACDSLRCGAQEYVGKYGTYFRDEMDFTNKLRTMWEMPYEIDTDEARSYIKQNFSAKKMASDIIDHLRKL